MNREAIENKLGSLDSVNRYGRVRILSFLSALIALCKPELTEAALEYLRIRKFDRIAIYETILQSYLFLGFPRMIEAAISFGKIFGRPEKTFESEFEKISPEESERWFQKGVDLCQIVYGQNYNRLKNRFMDLSPEIFRWMVIEGYGKVLTRPGLNSIERELAEVAALIIDGRERQLISHLMGSLNVGAPPELLSKVNEDIRPLSGETAYFLTVELISTAITKHDS